MPIQQYHSDTVNLPQNQGLQHSLCNCGVSRVSITERACARKIPEFGLFLACFYTPSSITLHTYLLNLVAHWALRASNSKINFGANFGQIWASSCNVVPAMARGKPAIMYMYIVPLLWRTTIKTTTSNGSLLWLTGYMFLVCLQSFLRQGVYFWLIGKNLPCALLIKNNLFTFMDLYEI